MYVNDKGNRNCANGPKRCALKIDLQKAYDTVNWSFIEESLTSFGFPNKMIRWIMAWITSPKFTICVNGERYGYFKRAEIKKEKLFKYHFRCRQLKITYLCFADDLLVMCHGDVHSVKTIKKALEKFSVVSRLQPNLGKSTMFCGSLDDETKGEIQNILPFKIGKLSVKYLGVPLMSKKIRVADCKVPIDKVTQKLSDWKNKNLTYAGRAQLIASVLSSMQVY
ncbi:RNA-directed DNA polymerase, eukaryota, reverse transcriptase zinc-binding domain protein [Tanacetum coccineum]